MPRPCTVPASVEPLDQLNFVLGDVDQFPFGETGDGRQLVFVAMFTELGAAGHHDQRTRPLERSENGAHACMGDDEIGVIEQLSKRVAVDQGCPPDVLGTELGSSDLGEYFRASSSFACPVVDRSDKTVEG